MIELEAQKDTIARMIDEKEEEEKEKEEKYKQEQKELSNKFNEIYKTNIGKKVVDWY